MPFFDLKMQHTLFNVVMMSPLFEYTHLRCNENIGNFSQVAVTSFALLGERDYGFVLCDKSSVV